MRMRAEDDDPGGGAAEPAFALRTVDAALARAELALLEEGIRLLDPPGEPSLPLQRVISRSPWLLCLSGGGEGPGRGEQGAADEKRGLEETAARTPHRNPLPSSLKKL
jgi:hypothetical protein